MRYALAVFLIVAGLVVGALGYLQRTLWAPSDTTVASATLNEPGSVVVVEPGVMNLYGKNSTLNVKGEGAVVVALASDKNIEAWVGESAHTKVTGLKSASELATAKVDGEQKTPNPAGADLWENQITGDGAATVNWDRDANRTALLIASDGTQQAPKEISISWPADSSTPTAIPLMIGGGVLLILGLLLLVMAMNDSARRKKRRVERTERRRKAATAGTAMMIVGALALTGCASEPELPKAEPSAAPSTAPPVVSEAQLKRVLEQISSDVAEGDAANDASKIEDRVTGPALELRKAAYDIRKKKDDFPLPTAIAASPMKINYTTASDSWPRVTSVVTQAEGSDVPQLLNLFQADARSSYQLWSATDLLPGVTVPETPDPRFGAELLAPDQGSLRVTPEDAASQYADVLLKGDGSKFKDVFAKDPYRTQLQTSQSEQKKAADKAKATLKLNQKPDDGQLIATSTADGGAIVTAYIKGSTQITPEKKDDQTGKISIPETAAKIIGKTETSKGVKTETGTAVTFFVPSSKDEQVQVLGISSSLISATEV
ncbi:hypothetical protein LWF01_04090 [Saxibacter everestensis]|uniref:DUF8094 domain-containing protein n=1 Tax=Saxibacter everestensis TaxID=2909229 RepID=A0ABY8QVA8_9MICO|nr:hypothetical protein LWF01_04090 [Brevibacteriaceae bacterium ZFBP1038]